MITALIALALLAAPDGGTDSNEVATPTVPAEKKRKPLVSTAPPEPVKQVAVEPAPNNDEERRKAALVLGTFLMGLGGRSASPVPLRQQQADPGCSSDFQCGFGNVCVKDQFAVRGRCAKAVNEFGNPTNPMPRLDSVNPGGTGQCSFDTECPVGFACRKSSGQLTGHCFKR